MELQTTDFSVFLVSYESQVSDSVTWDDLTFKPRYYADQFTSTGPIAGVPMHFNASKLADRCVIQWTSKTFPSPFANRAERIELAHGNEFVFRDQTHIVYVEKINRIWNERNGITKASLDEERLSQIRHYSKADLLNAARVFLSLPYVNKLWYREFLERTGFVQCRDGRVPRVRECNFVLNETEFVLNWDVCIFNLFTGEFEMDAEQFEYSRSVGGEDLVTFLECATVLKRIPAG